MIRQINRFILLAIMFVSATVAFAQVKTRLGETINRIQPTIVPVATCEGDVLFLDRKFNIDNFGGAKDKDDIWLSKKFGSFWTLPIALNGTFNSEFENVIFNILPDSKTVLYYDGAEKYPFFIAQIQNDSLKKIENIIIKNFSNKSKNFYGFLSYDAKTIFFALDNNDSRGDLDIYYSHKLKNGKWSDLINLGEKVNSAGIETSPFLALDNKTLYFASNRAGGHGGLDIYMTRRLDETWTNWSAPINLGDKINTKHDDYSLYLELSGDKGFLVSEDSLDDRQGIYRFEKMPHEYLPEPYCSLEGSINAGEFTINGLSSNNDYIYNSDKKTYRIIFNDSQRNNAIFKANSFESDTENIESYSATSVIKRDINLTPKKAKKISLYFENNISELDEKALSELENFIKSSNLEDANSISIIGYTNNLGENKSNLLLSKKRALAVKKEISRRLKKNINFELIGKGAIDDGNDENPLNRRTDLTIDN